MIKKFRFFAILATIGLLSLGLVIGASGIVNVIDPASDSAREAVLSPLLMPPDSAYVKISSEHSIAAPDKRTVARFDQIPAGFDQSIWVSFPEQKADVENADQVSFRIISSIKYSGEKGWVTVTVAKPSSAASAQGFLLGDQEVTLANGITAWATNDKNSDGSNQVAFVQDDLVISVISDLSVIDIQELSDQITIK